eukprot:TRINITY_DN3916_c0_g1_i1.p1 TRINITY_DN3916_c0_g1~~TRINITY_DN3916_c0_g1_i1.p1  ORF type:complete len:369 (+),score=38.47 TRINITY_DN3916_c0_g1_i1:618-1724(+)
MNAGYFKRFFVQDRKLGSGGYGGVWLCRHILQGFDLGTYAVKKIPIGSDRQWLLKVMSEVKSLERLHRHPNIVEYHHSWIENDQPADFGPIVPCLFVLMEYADMGTLDEYVRRRRLRGGEDEIWWITISACKALHHLHSEYIVHRDIKPGNILLNSSTVRFPHVLLSDLGEAIQVYCHGGAVGNSGSREGRTRSGNTGTLLFTAPELLAADETGRYLHQHNFHSDVWGLGMTLYYAAYTSLPFDETNVEEAEAQIRALGASHVGIPPAPTYSLELTGLIGKMLSPVPSSRPLPGEILRHPFVRAKSDELGELGDGSGAGSSPGNHTAPGRPYTPTQTPPSKYLRPDEHAAPSPHYYPLLPAPLHPAAL